MGAEIPSAIINGFNGASIVETASISPSETLGTSFRRHLFFRIFFAAATQRQQTPTFSFSPSHMPLSCRCSPCEYHWCYASWRCFSWRQHSIRCGGSRSIPTKPDRLSNVCVKRFFPRRGHNNFDDWPSERNCHKYPERSQ